MEQGPRRRRRHLAGGQEIAGSVSRNPAPLSISPGSEQGRIHLHALGGRLLVVARRQMGLGDNADPRADAGLLHDVGKMTIDDAVLNKPASSPTKNSWSGPSRRGHKMLLEGRNVEPHGARRLPPPSRKRRMARLSPPPGGQEIPSARMGAVCDVYDAITIPAGDETRIVQDGRLERPLRSRVFCASAYPSVPSTRPPQRASSQTEKSGICRLLLHRPSVHGKISAPKPATRSPGRKIHKWNFPDLAPDDGVVVPEPLSPGRFPGAGITICNYVAGSPCTSLGSTQIGNSVGIGPAQRKRLRPQAGKGDAVRLTQTPGVSDRPTIRWPKRRQTAFHCVVPRYLPRPRQMKTAVRRADLILRRAGVKIPASSIPSPTLDRAPRTIPPRPRILRRWAGEESGAEIEPSGASSSTSSASTASVAAFRTTGHAVAGQRGRSGTATFGRIRRLLERRAADRTQERGAESRPRLCPDHRLRFDGIRDRDLPRYVLVSDFARFRLFDLEPATKSVQTRRPHKRIKNASPSSPATKPGNRAAEPGGFIKAASTHGAAARPAQGLRLRRQSRSKCWCSCCSPSPRTPASSSPPRRFRMWLEERTAPTATTTPARNWRNCSRCSIPTRRGAENPRRTTRRLSLHQRPAVRKRCPSPASTPACRDSLLDCCAARLIRSPRDLRRAVPVDRRTGGAQRQPQAPHQRRTSSS